MEKRVLSQEQKHAYDMIALRKWVDDFSRKNKRDPTTKEVMSFLLVLHERAIVNTHTDLAELQDEEIKIREIAKDICHAQGVREDCIRIILAPNPSWSYRVQGGTPSELILGIRLKSPSFKIILADAIRKAAKVYRPSMLQPMGKVLEYRHEVKKIVKMHEDTEHYPLPDVSRIKVREYRVLEVYDSKTNESIKIDEQINHGMFSHYINDRLAHNGRLILARQMLSKGLLELSKSDDDENDGELGEVI